MKRPVWCTFLALATLAWISSSDPSTAQGDDKKDGKGTVVDFDGIQRGTPATWKEEEVKGPLRFMQFRLPKAKGDDRDAELVIFKNIGGSAQQNIDRWKGQFKPPAGKKID